jgi:hypothetical protein
MFCCRSVEYFGNQVGKVPRLEFLIPSYRSDIYVQLFTSITVVQVSTFLHLHGGTILFYLSENLLLL